MPKIFFRLSNRNYNRRPTMRVNGYRFKPKYMKAGFGVHRQYGFNWVK